MKNLVNYVILAVAVVLLVFGMTKSVNASSSVLFPSTGNNTPSSTTDGTTSTTPSTTPALNQNPINNTVVPVSDLNGNVSKDNSPVNITNNTPVNNSTTPANTTKQEKSKLPQTGENDIYIVTAVGIAALAIGTVAYIKSRKYDI